METVWQKVGNNVARLWKLCGDTVRLRLMNPLIPNATTIAAMREARAGGLKSFDSVDALMADLHGGRFMEITDTTFEAANRRGAAKKTAFPAAVAVRYDRRTARIVISLASGLEIAFLPCDVQGLEKAHPADLVDAEISPSGLGVHFPKIDADIYLPALLEGFLGSKRF